MDKQQIRNHFQINSEDGIQETLEQISVIYINLLLKQMESGTILHLALLKKIRSRSPIECQGLKLKNYRSAYSYHTTRTPSTSHTSRQSSEKYSSIREGLNFVRKKSNSFDKIINLQNKSGQLEDQNFTLSGWNNNEQEYDYKKVVRRQNFRIIDNQLQFFKKTQKNWEQTINRRKFSYCQQNLKHLLMECNQFKNTRDTKRNQHKNQRSKHLKPLVIEEGKTQQIQIQQKRQFQLDKQNSFCDILIPNSLSGAKKRITKKSKIQKITDFVQQFDDKFIRKKE